MVLITQQMGFAWEKHPPGACPSLEPDGHAFIQTNHPGEEKMAAIFLLHAITISHTSQKQSGYEEGSFLVKQSSKVISIFQALCMRPLNW